MDVYPKKNDTAFGRKKHRKTKTTYLKTNHPKKIKPAERRRWKKENRDRFETYLKKHHLEGKLGEVWIWSAIDPESKYVFPDVVGTRKRANGLQLVRQIKRMRKNHDDKLLIQTDNYDVYIGIIKECFADHIYTRCCGIPDKVDMPENLCYTILKKQRNASGEIESTEARIVFGHEKDILKILTDHNPTQGINTAYIERNNLNRRHFSARLRRKTLAISKVYEYLIAQLHLQRMYLNFCWPQHTLSHQNKRPTSAAMAAKITKTIWTLKDLLMVKIHV